MKANPVASWCTCTKCNDNFLVGSREFCCCREVAEVYGKVVFEGLDHECVILYPDFRMSRQGQRIFTGITTKNMQILGKNNMIKIIKCVESIFGQFLFHF